MGDLVMYVHSKSCMQLSPKPAMSITMITLNCSLVSVDHDISLEPNDVCFKMLFKSLQKLLEEDHGLVPTFIFHPH